MLTNPPTRSLMDDPRRLRDMLDRAHELVSTHDVSSVVVGLAGFEGDQDFPDLVDYVVSALRIDDSVLRLTSERAVVLLADTDVGKAGEVMERVMQDYCERFPSLSHPAVGLGYYELKSTQDGFAVKDVLPRIFQVPRSH